ncbi:ABA4-like family protein [Prosthecobacter fluviatilis]|uniref:ABA4-like family protein n=1 Tax=Prosthecobacter fluviatilis TaxID=445931 RepID=A0ABW0KNA5_9BACT
MDLYASAFKICNFYVAPFWLSMVFLPRWKGTEKLMRPLWPIFLICLPYALLNIPYYLTNLPIFARGNFVEITKLFADPHCVALAWIHFLGVDLFVGRWIHFDSLERGYNRWLVAPCLLLTLLVGPTGTCAYLLLRALKAPSAPSQAV